jgi:hypothetical protein
MTINTFTSIKTCMGQLTSNSLPFLSEKEIEEFNTVGYTGKNSKGEKSSYEDYLNSLGKGEFAVTMTKFDDGSFHEEFTIVQVV